MLMLLAKQNWKVLTELDNFLGKISNNEILKNGSHNFLEANKVNTASKAWKSILDHTNL